MLSEEKSVAINTEQRLNCTLCDQSGTIVYKDLEDRLYNTSGKWDIKKCINKDCGLTWLNPAPCKEDLWKAYITYYTHQDACTLDPPSVGKRVFRYLKDCYLSYRYGYFENGSISRLKWLGLLLYLVPGKRADVDFCVMSLPYKPHGRLLEVGCGSGSMLSYMNSLGWQTEGIDFDPSAVSNALEKGLKVSVGSLEAQNFDDAIFDAIMMSHVIEHIPDPVKVLSECYRILKPGGILTLVTPNTESLGHRIFGRFWLHLDPPRHLVLFNRKALLGLARQTGFTDLSLKTTVRDAHSLFWASYMIRTHGQFKMGTRPGKGLKMFFSALRLVEWLLIKVLPWKGEELSLLGRKK